MTSTIKVNTITTESGSTLTLGESGKTVTLASGASQSGFGREGSVDWQTGSIKTSTFTAASGEGYFINASGAITMNLPAGTAGAIVAVSDYARNFATHNLTIAANGSNLIGGRPGDATLNVNGQAATFVYVDDTKGWVNVQNAEDTEQGATGLIEATGGTETESGNCKIHTFTGPGTFTVSRIATTCAPTNNLVSYMVVAGGGGGGKEGGGGGAGGYREVVSPSAPYTGSPTQGFSTPGNRITVTATAFPITVGAGGAGGTGGKGCTGSNSIFSTITAAGGGFGGSKNPANPQQGDNGGSGGGNGRDAGCGTGGTGNTPPVTPAQGTNGGGVPGTSAFDGGGGGGATAAGGAGASQDGGDGGAGATSSINATPTARAGGGGGGSDETHAGSGGTGGGGAGANTGSGTTTGTAGTANTGGGGGGGGSGSPGAGGSGGSGIVVIRYKFQ
tara:strand:+ start:451 stop:1791 length:1341 start_codon:yes stop_codon:yes gene_type:complete